MDVIFWSESMTRKIAAAIAAFLALLSIVPFAGTWVFAQSQDFSLQSVATGVWVAIATDTGRAGGNAGFVIGDDGIAVIDTFEHPDAAGNLLAAIRRVSPLPIRFVINTHYHLDHVNGNDVFANTGALVFAHRNVRAWMRTENLKWWGEAIKPEDKARVQSLKLPDAVYDDGMDLYLGRRLLELRFFPGHTGGDTLVRINDARIVFCGDLLWKGHVPNLIDASTEQWIATLNVLRNNYPQSVFVPGHGGIADSADVTTFRDYLVDLRTRVGDAQGRGESGNALVNAILPSLKNKYGAWGFFDDFAKENILQTAQEVVGRKRVPQSLKSGGTH